VYHDNIAADVPPERLERFFTRAGDKYQVVDPIRQMVIFAVQSVIKDPPFSRMDLITCRNLLIYLMPELQEKVIFLFHYALKPAGFLFLGSSETILESAPYYELVDRKWKLYRRRDGDMDHGAHRDFPVLPWVKESTMEPEAPAANGTVLRQHLERVLLERYVFPSLVLSAAGKILFTYGRVGRYLEPAAGETGRWEILNVMREELRAPLGSSLRRAVSSQQAVVYRGARFSTDGETRVVNLTVEPLRQPAVLEGLLLVHFEEVEPQETESAREAHPPDDVERVAELERELQATREYLQATIEELQSSNEEINSTNEELQSANEELETAQEETQSVNEELATLNEELESKVDELTWANSDMRNLLANIGVGIIFLDRHLRIRRFNQAAAQLINLVESDVGRPVEHFSSDLLYQGWVQDARKVFESLVPHQERVRVSAGEWYEIRIRPYRTEENAIEGVVLTFAEVTAQRHSEEEIRTAYRLAQGMADTVREPLLVLDAELRVVSANRQFYRTFRVTPEATLDKYIYDLGSGQWDIPELRRLLEEIIPENTMIDDYLVEHEFDEIGQRRMRLNARQLTSVSGQPELILLAIQDTTSEA
jgi:two-component system CheB/CheR fusion protein